MPVSPADLLQLAETLSEGSTECEWRAAISRAYYAALHVALQITQDPACAKHLLDTSSWDAGFAVRVIGAFSAPKAAHTVKGAGYVLSQLKQDRVAADYSLDIELKAV